MKQKSMKKASLIERVSGTAKKSFKEHLFNTISFYMYGKDDVHENIFYLTHAIEALSFLWFSITPTLNLFGPNIYLFQYLCTVLKAINFYEYTAEGIDYKVMIWVVVGYLLSMVIAGVVTQKLVFSEKDNKFSRLMRSLVNCLFTSNVYIFTIPFFGLAINTLYCHNDSPYHLEGTCYDLEHLFYCFMAFLIFVMTAYFTFAVGLFFYSRNPFQKSYFGQPNRDYVLAKFVIKIFYIIYFALNYSIKLEFLFVIAAPALWGLYLFYYRINNLHSSDHRHYYKQLFLEGFIFFASATSCALYYMTNRPNTEPMSLINLILISIAGAFALVALEKYMHAQFLKQCIFGNYKKNYMDRFVRGLINELVHDQNKKGVITLEIYQFLINKNYQETKVDKKGDKRKAINIDDMTDAILQFSEARALNKHNTQNENDDNIPEKTESYKLLLLLVNKLIKNSNNVGLKMIKAEILKLLGCMYYSYHCLLELQQLKLTLSEQFAVYDMLRACQKDILLSQKQKQMYQQTNLRIIYMYQRESSNFQELMNECAVNNRDYWEELGQVVPSLPKLRNLAEKYVTYSTAIAKVYETIQQIQPESCVPTVNYLCFLLQVGVNAQETIKIRQELRSQFKKMIQQRGEGIYSEQSMAMIAVDSVGASLGHVINCNKQTKSFLGYEKENIIGKNITRIMPKVYAELHNNFIINFIKGQSEKKQTNDIQDTSSHLVNTREKIVTPLTTEGLLMEVRLRLYPVAEIQGSLLIVGFMSRQEDNGQAVIMIDSISGLVLAIDAKFESMLKHSITGRQVLLEDLNLATLLPQINIKQLEINGSQESFLYLEHLFEHKSGSTVNLDVSVQIRRVKIYEGRKLTFLSIKCKNEYFSSTQINNIKTNKAMKNKTALSLIPQLTNQYQITQSFKAPLSSLIEGDGQQLSNEIPLIKKIEDYIEKYQAKIKILVLNIIYAASIVIVYALFNYVYLTYEAALDEVDRNYHTMQKMANVSYQISQVSLNSNKIWSLQTQEFHFSNYSNYYPLLKASVLKLVSQKTQISREIINTDYPLVYNQQILSNYRIYKNINGNNSYENVSLTFSNALENYIASAKIIMEPGLVDSRYATNKLLISQHAYYIAANGDKLLSSMTLEAIFSYYNYTHDNLAHAVTVNVSIKIFIAILALLFGLFSIAVGLLFIEKQKDILKFYSKLRLWDLAELSSKCQQFLQRNRKAQKITRGISLLNIMPANIFIGLANKKFNQTTPKFKKQLQSCKIMSNDEEQQHLQKGDPDYDNYQISNKERKVNVEIELVKNYQIAVIIIVFLYLLGQSVWAVSMGFQYSVNQQIFHKIQILRDISVVRKTLTHMDLYASRVVSEPPDLSYSTKIASQAELFYKYSTITFDHIGNQVLSDVYSATQLLQHYFTKPSEYSPAFLKKLYDTRISVTLQKACEKIVVLDQTVFYPEFRSKIEKGKLIQIINTVLVHILYGTYCIIFSLVILKKNKATVSMLRILPAWVIERSSQAHKQILQ